MKDSKSYLGSRWVVKGGGEEEEGEGREGRGRKGGRERGEREWEGKKRGETRAECVTSTCA